MATKFNAAFWKWFGDSKVTNSNGNPLTVYHGSRNIIEEFDIGMCEFGCHFGTKAQAESIMTRGDHLYECYLSIQNPIRLKDCGGWTWECLWKQLEGHGFDIPAMKPAEEARGYAVVRRQIAEHGYDGIVYLNRHEAISHDDIDKVMDLWMRGKTDKNWARESSDTEFRKVVKSARDSWIVLNPAQIKSIDNDGTWESGDNDIRSNPESEFEFLPYVPDGGKGFLVESSKEFQVIGWKVDNKGYPHHEHVEALLSEDDVVRSKLGNINGRMFVLIFPAKNDDDAIKLVKLALPHFDWTGVSDIDEFAIQWFGRSGKPMGMIEGKIGSLPSHGLRRYRKNPQR